MQNITDCDGIMAFFVVRTYSTIFMQKFVLKFQFCCIFPRYCPSISVVCKELCITKYLKLKDTFTDLDSLKHFP